jgi:hypothetical protein
MERYYISNYNVGSFYKSNFTQGNINVCGEIWNSGETTQNRSRTSNATSTKPEKRHDLTEAPECDRVYNRTTELTTLKLCIGNFPQFIPLRDFITLHDKLNED